ncbi:hypothetical protein F503_08229 [Ophiostoma piceae UAMH 11346]|uniref:DUF4048 domain-containing protein n=1 Tax=Ophiostoma piceae (strain UAMH 11346) TaxID=1262450 RepID=S3CHC6_OPHP1|nr:hypothetical protein F503_08229 [Ophiostoma piceae UAMH 11346]
MTGFLLQLCFASALSRQLPHDSRTVRRTRSLVVSNSRRTTSPPSRIYRQRRWRCALHSNGHHRKNQRHSLFLPPSFPPSSSVVSRSTNPNSLVTDTLISAAPCLHSAINQAVAQHLFGQPSDNMADSVSKPAPPPAARANSNSSEEDSSSDESSRPSTSSSDSESMPPPPQPRVSTPPSAPLAYIGAGIRTPGDRLDESIETRSSRSASTASRSNRLSLTLPIALPTSFPSRPIPASATLPSFPGTPVDISSAAAPEDPADLITAIAAQERHVLELREVLNRAENNLLGLKKQWANHEARKKRGGDSRRSEAMRGMPSRPGTASATDSPTASVEGSSSRRSSELDRRRALLQSQQPGTVEPNTPSQSRRRVFRGGHARTLSLLSPTKTVSDDFPVHEDQADDESLRSPVSSQDAESPFLQNLGRYAPNTATHLSKRSSWAPQTVHQVTGAGLRQVAGDLTTTLWTFVEDLRQATVGEELANGASAVPGLTNPRAAGAADDSQNTIRAPSTSSRPHAARAFGGDLQGTPTPSSRYVPSDQQASSKDKPVVNSKAKTGKVGKSTHGKANKHFSWTPLTVESYDDSDWTNWDSPTVKSPRWSGSTVNGEPSDASLEQADENTTPQKRDSILSSFSPTSPGNKNSELYAALNRLTPGNIKRTATDLMKEWEKSLSAPLDAQPGHNARVEERSS